MPAIAHISTVTEAFRCPALHRGLLLPLALIQPSETILNTQNIRLKKLPNEEEGVGVIKGEKCGV